MSTIVSPETGTFVTDPGFPEVPDLVYSQDELVSRAAVLLLDRIVGGQTYAAVESAEGIEDLAELTELGYVTVEDPRGGAPVITVTDFGHQLLAGIQANHPDVLPCD